MKKSIWFIAFVLLTGYLFELSAQFKNKGTLVISNNFSLVVKDKDFINDGTVIMKNDGKLYVRGGDFINNGTFGDNTLTETYRVIFDGANDQEIRGNSEPYIYELVTAQTGNSSVTQSINVSTHTIHVGDAGNLFDYKVKDPSDSDIKGLRLTADEFVLDGNLRLYDDSQILQNTNTITVSGSGKLFRDQMGYGSKYWYNYWCAPVNNGGTWKVADLMDGRDPENPQPVSFVDDGTGEGSDQVNDGNNPAVLNEHWIYKFENNAPDYANWQQIKSQGTTTPGQGYTMKGPGIQNASRPGADDGLQFKGYTFAGAPNGGTYGLDLGAGHMYLIGNPYPSALDADKFIQENDGQFSGTLYFWEHLGGDNHYLYQYYGGYGTYNLSGGAKPRNWKDSTEISEGKIPGRYIPVAQGFIVYNDGNSNGRINLTNDQRVFYKEDADSSLFLSPMQTNIRLTMTGADNLTRELLLAVRSNTSMGYDWGWDGYAFDFGGASDMSFLLDGKDLVIQAVPALDDQLRLPLHVYAPAEGNVEFGVSEMSRFPAGLQMYIEDTRSGHTAPVDLNTTYRTYLPAGDYTDRFYLVFRASTMGTDDLSKAGVDVYYNDGIIYIQNPEGLMLGTARVYDMSGKVVLEKELHSDAHQISIPAVLAKGVYVIRTESGDKALNKKFLAD